MEEISVTDFSVDGEGFPAAPTAEPGSCRCYVGGILCLPEWAVCDSLGTLLILSFLTSKSAAEVGTLEMFARLI